MIVLFILSVLVTVLCFGTLYLGLKEKGRSFDFHVLIDSLREASEKPKEKASIYLMIFFISLIFLPLFWGLSFLLKTDANVLAVLVTMAWGYNLVKYTFPIHAEDEKKEETTQE